MTKEEAKRFGLKLLHGIMERNESYPVYANNVKQAIDALSETSGYSEIPKGLNDAAEEYAKGEGLDNALGGWEDMHDAFITGAKWQKAQSDKELSEKIAAAYQLGLADKEKQMMKEAVEGYVTLTMTGTPTVAATIKEGDNIGVGDKVRIIIVKEG